MARVVFYFTAIQADYCANCELHKKQMGRYFFKKQSNR
jgi:hypothetical protein